MIDVILMGRKLGTASSRGRGSHLEFNYYEFESLFLPETLPKVECLVVDVSNGVIEGYRDGTDKEPTYRYDAVQILHHLWRDTPLKEKRVER